LENALVSGAGGAMLGLKQEIEAMAASIKTIKKELDDELQQTVMKSSNLVEINKNMEEIQLAGRLILNLIKDNNMKAVEKLLGKMCGKIYGTRLLLAKDIQKSMLKAAQDLAEAENGLILMADLNDMVDKFNTIEEEISADSY